jgi:hypothetical protein
MGHANFVTSTQQIARNALMTQPARTVLSPTF